MRLGESKKANFKNKKCALQSVVGFLAAFFINWPSLASEILVGL